MELILKRIIKMKIKLLCKIGFHLWRYVKSEKTYIAGNFREGETGNVMVKVYRCKNCGKEKWEII